MSTKISDTEMTEGAPRANRNGDACPPWCATDHYAPVIPDRPELGCMDAHRSDPVTGSLYPATVRVRRHIDGTGVEVYTAPGGLLSVAPEQAGKLAALLDWIEEQGCAGQLAAELRTAAGIAGAGA